LREILCIPVLACSQIHLSPIDQSLSNAKVGSLSSGAEVFRYRCCRDGAFELRSFGGLGSAEA